MKRILGLILLLLGVVGISQAAFYTRIPYQNVAGKMQVKVSVGGVEGDLYFLILEHPGVPDSAFCPKW